MAPARAARVQETVEVDTGTIPILALARRSSTFMAKWGAIDPKPRSYLTKIPNQYSTKLRKLPEPQQHYALLDAQEYWLEILADHWPPDWVNIPDVLAQLATIIPMAAPCSTRPYLALKNLLKKAIDATSKTNPSSDANIRCSPIPVTLLQAVKINGSAQAGAGELPHKISDSLEAAHLGWLLEDPSTCTIPRCWRTWAIRHNYPHAAYINLPVLPPTVQPPAASGESTRATQARSPTRRRSPPRHRSPTRHRSSTRFDDRLNIKGIPRRFSVPHRASPELGRAAVDIDEDAHEHDYDGMLIEDDESFELWDAGFREEELHQAHNDLKADHDSGKQVLTSTGSRGISRSPSPSGFEADYEESTAVETEPSFASHTSLYQPISTMADQQANVFNIKTMDDVRRLLTDLGSEEAIRCPTAIEVLPQADNDVHEAFTAYTRYFSAKVKAAMKLTLGQILLASPLAKLVKRSDAMQRDLDYYRDEAESVRQELPEAINAVQEENQREVDRLHHEIAGLKSAVSRTMRRSARNTATQGIYQITTRSTAARAGRLTRSSARGTRSRPEEVPGVATRARPLGINLMATNAARKRGGHQHPQSKEPSRKRQMISKSGNAKKVYASYFAEDE